MLRVPRSYYPTIRNHRLDRDIKTVKNDWYVSILLLLVKYLFFVCFADVVNKSFVWYRRL